MCLCVLAASSFVMMEEHKHTYGDVVVFPYDGGQHRTGTQLGPDVVVNTLEVKDVHKVDVDHGDGYKLKSADELIIRERPFGTEFMWNADSLKKNTRLIYDTVGSKSSTDCFGMFGDHSMEGGFFMGNQRRLKKLGFNHHLVMMDAHGDSHHPSSSPSGLFLIIYFFFLAFVFVKGLCLPKAFVFVLCFFFFLFVLPRECCFHFLFFSFSLFLSSPPPPFLCCFPFFFLHHSFWGLWTLGSDFFLFLQKKKKNPASEENMPFSSRA